MKTFIVGNTYNFTFIGDSDSCVPVKILSRTAKMVTVQVFNEAPKKVKVHEWEGAELAYPLGRYSMNPIIRAGE